MSARAVDDPVGQVPHGKPSRSATETATFLRLARARFKQAQEADKNQRARELEDLKFYAGDQWPQDVLDRRKAQPGTTDLPAAPARPCITINNTREPVRQVLNQERAADMGIEIVPADDFGDLDQTPDETEILLREGLTRRIQRESKAADARTWAFMRSTIAGRGFYGVMTRYVPGKTMDKEIYVHRWYDQTCVLIDPAHEQPDGSDAEWGFVANDLTWARYTAEHGTRNGEKNRVCDWAEGDWGDLGTETKDWFKTEGETRICRVVDYYYTVYASRDLCELADGSVEWADELPDDLPKGAIIDKRPVIEKSIKWAKIDGCDDDVLDETDWEGPDMPIVKVLGEELQPYDAERRVEGMVRPMIQPGQGLNYMVSRWVEVIGLSPIVPIMMAEGQDEGYEAEWDAITTRTLGRVHYKQTDLEDRPAPAPTVSPSQQPPIEAIAGSVQLFKQALQSTSGIEAAALGQADTSVRSNKQARLLVEQSRQGSNHYLDNLQRSIRYEGQIINNLLYAIYGRKGRIARILNKEGDAEHVLLHQPMVMQGGRPMPAPAGAADAKTYALTKDAQFNVIIKVAKNFDSRREQENQILGSLLEASPEMMTIIGDLYFKSLDGPGHTQMAERMKAMLDPKIQQLIAAKEQGQNPETQAQLAGAQQQIETLTAQLQEATAPGAVEQIKAQGALDLKKADLDFQREKLAVESETKLAVAELSALAKELQQTAALFAAERARLGVQGHEVGMTALAQGHEADMAERGHTQALEQGDAQAATAGAQAEAERAHQAEMARQAQAAAGSNGGGA